MPSKHPQHWAAHTLQHINQQLQDTKNNLRADLSPCGVQALQALLQNHASIQCNATTLHNTRQLAHTQMLSQKNHNAVPLCWRRLYTDTSLLLSLIDLHQLNQNEAFWRDSISRLDHAIVIAGAPGDGRLDLILDIIELIQHAYLPLQHAAGGATTPYLNALPRLPKPFSADSSVPVHSAPSLPAFLSSFSKKPFILRGFAINWPALTNHPWSSKAYLRQASGHGRVVPVEVGKDYRADDWTQKMMGWDDFLDHLLPDDSPSTPANEVIYLAQHDIFKQFPQLRCDIIVPDYAYCELQPPAHFPHYKPPGNDEGLVINAWFGPKGTVSPAHTDPYFNFYTQVVGRKTVWLAPPHLAAAMSPCSDPDGSTVAQSPPQSHSQPHNPAANQTTPTLTNTSRIDVFADHSLVAQGLMSDEEKRFCEEVTPFAMSATLEPGDLLFFPPGWWHAMRSEDTSFSVSMWF